MSKEIEEKLEKIPVINLLVRLGKKVKIPGLEGMSLYDVIEMYIIGIIEGALTTRASGIAYSFFMAIFPFMLFVLTLIPYIPIDGFQESLMTLISEILPPKTFKAVDTVLLDIIENKQVGLLSFGFLASIFLMTNGVNAIFGGFEFSYHVKEARNFLRAYFLSMLVSLIMALFLVITVALTGFYQLLLDAMINKKWIEDETLWLSLGRGVLFVLMIFTIVSILYKYGTKSGKHSRFLSPGSVFTTLLSILTFYVFSFYVNEFAQYNELYGSIGTLLILMLFIWLNAIILLLGFELNASIYSLRLKNKTQSEE
ncbi:YihY/virulence factor BrkB family protein [Pseudotenacibaculum sp. MALMAid0570]|uniref:YihY/virulence factor BrkB family protein n=1 Tax=Pseudotenacibaculum sp. MALMAid0570 TaxID=3143938 RepID=UPI0032DFED4D